MGEGPISHSHLPSCGPVERSGQWKGGRSDVCHFQIWPLRLCDLYSLSPHLLSHMEDRRDKDSSEDPEKMGEAHDGRHRVPE